MRYGTLLKPSAKDLLSVWYAQGRPWAELWLKPNPWGMCAKLGVTQPRESPSFTGAHGGFDVLTAHIPTK